MQGERALHNNKKFILSYKKYQLHLHSNYLMWKSNRSCKWIRTVANKNSLAIEKVHTECCKFLLHTYYKAANKVVWAERGRLLLFINAHSGVLSYWIRLIRHPFTRYLLWLTQRLDDARYISWVYSVRILLFKRLARTSCSWQNSVSEQKCKDIYVNTNGSWVCKNQIVYIVILNSKVLLHLRGTLRQ